MVDVARLWSPEGTVYRVRAYERGGQFWSQYLGRLYDGENIWGDVATYGGHSPGNHKRAQGYILTAFPRFAQLGTYMHGYLEIPESNIPPGILNLL